MLAFRAAPVLANGHLQTVLPALLGASPRTRVRPSEPMLFSARDGELLAGTLDLCTNRPRGSALAVLVHGLEGSSEIAYVRRVASKLLAMGWHVLRLNQRGCGAGEHLTRTWNHGGRGDDVLAVLEALEAKGFAPLAAVGFSLGGSLVLRMLGERAGHLPRALACAAAISPLVNPLVVQRHLDGRQAWAYRAFFLALMTRRLRRRARLFPDAVPDPGFVPPATVREFDDRFTAPHCGFQNAEDYYRRADSLPLVGRVEVPTLLLHAQDDPLVPFACYREALAVLEGTRSIQARFPGQGGHLGFVDPALGFWAEEQALAFLRRFGPD